MGSTAKLRRQYFGNVGRGRGLVRLDPERMLGGIPCSAIHVHPELFVESRAVEIGQVSSARLALVVEFQHIGMHGSFFCWVSFL